MLNVTVAPLTADSRRMSYDSSIGSRAMKADSGSLVRSPTVAVHPSMEGLVSFVPPELTERTLMHVGVHRRLRICAVPFYGRRATQMRTLYFCPVVSFFFFFFFYLSPNLSGCRLYVYHTSTHGVALLRI